MPKTTKEIIDYVFNKKRELSVRECLIFADEFDLNIIWFSKSEVDEQLDALRSLMSQQHYDSLEQIRKEILNLKFKENGFYVVSELSINDVFASHGLVEDKAKKDDTTLSIRSSGDTKQDGIGIQTERSFPIVADNQQPSKSNKFTETTRSDRPIPILKGKSAQRFREMTGLVEDKASPLLKNNGEPPSKPYKYYELTVGGLTAKQSEMLSDKLADLGFNSLVLEDQDLNKEINTPSKPDIKISFDKTVKFLRED